MSSNSILELENVEHLIKDYSLLHNNSESEKEVDQKNVEMSKDEYPSVSLWQLYKFATNTDKLCILAGILCCLGASLCLSISYIFYGECINVIIRYISARNNNTNETEILITDELFMEDLKYPVIVNCLLAFGMLTFTTFFMFLFNHSGFKQMHRIKGLFVASMLTQDIGWYDVNRTGDFSSRLSDDMNKIEDGITDKAPMLLHHLLCFSCNLIVALTVEWKLTLVFCLFLYPGQIISTGVIPWITSKLARKEADVYAKASVVADEALNAVKTVVAFGGQKKEQERYNELLLVAANTNIKRSLLNGFCIGARWFFQYLGTGLAYWFAAKLILNERQLSEGTAYDAGNVIIINQCIGYGTAYVALSTPYLEACGMAQGAASKIFSVISLKPIINASKGHGIRPTKLEGNLTFDNVQFTYPSRQKVKILQGLTLKVTAGETVALVGSSGCGKSTLVQLIQRFYDLDGGKIYIDETDITELDLNWLREHIGVVEQEPVLFQNTIAENIKYGCRAASQEEIENAAKKANAHAFITSLPRGYDTYVGEKGVQLSVGQKQRIAIARALVRKPTILLLDEATSALDTKSEAVVQAALDNASRECTTIIVAHRLSTVRKADRIVVISEGRIKEQGTHDDLIAAKGTYYELITSQMAAEVEMLDSVNDENNVLHDDLDDLVNTDANSLLDHPLVQSTRYNLPRANTLVETAEEDDEEVTRTTSVWRVLKYSSQEWLVITIGCLCCLIVGMNRPVQAIIFGFMIKVFANVEPNYLENQIVNLLLYSTLLAIVMSLSTFVQTYMFGIAGEKLTMRLRSEMFRTMLNQEMAWFDKTENGIGALGARLSGEPSFVQGATGQRISAILDATSTIVICLGTCFYFEWRLTLFCLCFAPFCVMSIYYEKKLIVKETQRHKLVENATKIAAEAINGIRTVASLGCEHTFIEQYRKESHSYQQTLSKNSRFKSFAFGTIKSLLWFTISITFYYGGILIRDEKIDYIAVVVVAQSVVISSFSLASALALTPNFQKGVIAAKTILQLLQRVPRILNGSNVENESLEKAGVEYEQIVFSYPIRPNVEVLKGLDLSVLEGKTVALVGHSGCGKSTVVQLLERFYDPSLGYVKVERKNIRNMNLSSLRSHLGIVSQEPNLFSRTIAENIAYGDNTRKVTMGEIIDAAKQANIHHFIASLPLGYETKLGGKGTQLSGGQKQRVAIARALIRNPKVLLLDEATSSLDSESEKVVQEALDNAKIGRTCIIIAHRLSTIQNADLICVIDGGKVAEMGTHSELIQTRGLYYDLCNVQQNSLCV